jgi:hypothetical protein
MPPSIGASPLMSTSDDIFVIGPHLGSDPLASLCASRKGRFAHDLRVDVVVDVLKHIVVIVVVPWLYLIEFVMLSDKVMQNSECGDDLRILSPVDTSWPP